jgi:hypothetical protein
MCALAQTQDKRLTSVVPFDSIKMLSLGTGFRPYHLDGEETWGLAQWAPHLVNLLMDGVNEVADFQTAQLMSDGAYYRVPLVLQTDIAMDDASELGILQRIGAAADISRAIQFVKQW